MDSACLQALAQAINILAKSSKICQIVWCIFHPNNDKRTSITLSVFCLWLIFVRVVSNFSAGAFLFGFAEENGGRFIGGNVTAGQTVFIPQGDYH